jgi:uncharacterized protein (DUF1330 family)
VPIFIIAQITIHDRSEYSKYETGFFEIFQKFSGRLLSVDEEPTVLEGKWPHTRTVLVEFPSNAEAMAWYQSDEYQKLAQHRLASSDGNIVLIKGFDGDGRT